jgi:hypothetical protein
MVFKQIPAFVQALAGKQKNNLPAQAGLVALQSIQTS